MGISLNAKNHPYFLLIKILKEDIPMNSKMRRQKLRDDARYEDRAKTRLYNYDEVVDLMHKIINRTENHYCAKYSQILAVALNAEPYNFGKRRICRLLELFYDQIKGLHDKTIEYELISQTAKTLGVIVENKDEKYTINIDARTKKQKETEPIKTIFIGGEENDKR